MNWLNNWYTWGLGFLGVGGLVAAMVFPSVLRIIAVAFDIISPVAKGFFEFLVEWIKILWEGFKDVLDTWQTMVLVLTLMGGLWVTMKVYDKVEDLSWLEKIETCDKRVQALIKENRELRAKKR